MPIKITEQIFVGYNVVQIRHNVLRCLKEKQCHYFLLRKARLEGSNLCNITQMIWAQNTKPFFFPPTPMSYSLNYDVTPNNHIFRNY